ncbi:MAG: hypothetical protein ACJKSS_02810 [Patescibacteria group bacterium UBA2103]
MAQGLDESRVFYFQRGKKMKSSFKIGVALMALSALNITATTASANDSDYVRDSGMTSDEVKALRKIGAIDFILGITDSKIATDLESLLQATAAEIGSSVKHTSVASLMDEDRSFEDMRSMIFDQDFLSLSANIAGQGLVDSAFEHAIQSLESTYGDTVDNLPTVIRDYVETGYFRWEQVSKDVKTLLLTGLDDSINTDTVADTGAHASTGVDTQRAPVAAE